MGLCAAVGVWMPGLAMLTSCARWDGEAVYHPAGKHKRLQATFRVGLPGENWLPMHDRSAALQVAWRHRHFPLVIEVRSQCEEHGDASLETFTGHLAIDFGEWQPLPRQDGATTIAAQRTFRLVERDALRSHVRATLDGAPVELEVVVVKKDGCLFDLLYIAAPEAFGRGLADFEKVIAGFRFPLRGRGSR